VPVIDHWWQTETGWAIVANPAGIELLPVKLGSPTVPMPGYEVEILGEDGRPLPAGQLGAVAIKLPLPPGTLPTLWNAEARFVKSYLTTFPATTRRRRGGDRRGWIPLRHGAHRRRDQRGRASALHRRDGEVLAAIPTSRNAPVIGVADELKGQAPMGFLCLNKAARVTTTRSSPSA
jgi:propionyl-CoA synthetase